VLLQWHFTPVRDPIHPCLLSYSTSPHSFHLSISQKLFKYIHVTFVFSIPGWRIACCRTLPRSVWFRVSTSNATATGDPPVVCQLTAFLTGPPVTSLTRLNLTHLPV